MPMNVQAISSLPDKINQIRLLTAEIINKEILPNENKLWRTHRDGDVSEQEKQTARELRRDIREKIKQAGLWAPHLPEEYGGCGLSFLEHAYMNEVLAYAVGAASLFGVVAPHSGNQNTLLNYGHEERRQKWLVPPTDGRMQSVSPRTVPHSPSAAPAASQKTLSCDWMGGSSGMPLKLDAWPTR